ncbi:hypothetical protein YC2023_008619 [Brassica napus]
MFWPHSHAIANHFSIVHPSFHYSSSSMLNSGVLSECAPEKVNQLCQINSLKSFSHITTRDVTDTNQGILIKGYMTPTLPISLPTTDKVEGST